MAELDDFNQEKEPLRTTEFNAKMQALRTTEFDYTVETTEKTGEVPELLTELEENVASVVRLFHRLEDKLCPVLERYEILATVEEITPKDQRSPLGQRIKNIDETVIDDLYFRLSNLIERIEL